jgi:predicted nucleic acid-binding protein
MGILLDTNILSELRKGGSANPNVRAWQARVRTETQWLSVLSLGEIRQGIETIRRKDLRQANALEDWLSGIELNFAGEILPVCGQVAAEWGRLNATRSLPVIDGLLAATASVHRLRIATRNVSDFIDTGVLVENPFEKTA